MKGVLLLAVSLVLMSGPACPPPGEVIEVRVSLDVPDAAWRIHIEEVLLAEGEVRVVSRLERPPLMAAQVISTVSDSVEVGVPKLPIKHFILGKAWGWDNDPALVFIREDSELEELRENCRVVYRRDPEK